jgi:hypothetical protein
MTQALYAYTNNKKIKIKKKKNGAFFLGKGLEPMRQRLDGLRFDSCPVKKFKRPLLHQC